MVNESQQQKNPHNVYSDIGPTRQKIMTAQFECYQKIMKDNDNVKGTATKKTNVAPDVD